MSEPRLVTLGDSCLSLILGDGIDSVVNARCVAIAHALDEHLRDGVRDILPTFNAVTVHFEATRVDRRDLEADLRRFAMAAVSPVDPDAEPIRIPVEYGGEAGPDLPAVAGFGGCAEEDVVRLHTAAVYRVYMLGFLPGFAYMGSVDERIAMPRLDTPRMRVATGSVAIAGLQTGIYPCDTPGGWRIIGRTTVNVFDAARATPCLLKAGDRVRFVTA